MAMDDKATAAKMDYNTATAQECADWLAGDDGWEMFDDGVWRRDKPGQREYEYLYNTHPYPLTLDAAAGAMKRPWRLERIEVASDGKNTVTIYNGYTANRISIEGRDRLTAEYRAAVAARLDGMEGRG